MAVRHSNSAKCTVDELADAINQQLTEYNDLAADEVKEAVKQSAKTVKTEISANAPQNTGAYAKSWATKTTRETASSMEITVHSKNRYQLAHLLENGHAKRGGGRVAARTHIAPAEEKGITELENEIKRRLSDG